MANELVEWKEEGIPLLEGPEEEGADWRGSFIGGGWGEPGWTPPKSPPSPTGEDSWTDGGDAEQELLNAMRKKAAQYGVKPPGTYEEALEFEMFLPGLERKGEVEELERKARMEEAKTRMSALRAARPTKLQKFLKGAGRTWKGAKEVAGPRGKVSREWYIPKAQKELYVPKVPSWRPTTEFMPAGEAHRPQLGTLRRAGSPPPSVPIKAPFRDVERFEGLGSALGRLRGLEKLPAVDQAVYSEIHANGDIDIPSHVKREVGQFGFSRKEIDTSLNRLRNLGLVVPTGQISNGEKELMVVGD